MPTRSSSMGGGGPGSSVLFGGSSSFPLANLLLRGFNSSAGSHHHREQWTLLVGVVAGLCLASLYHALTLPGSHGDSNNSGSKAGGSTLMAAISDTQKKASSSSREGGLLPTRRPTIILFGDSLTQRGWAASLSNAYTRRADIINRGFSGYNSQWCRLMVEEGLFGGGGGDYLQTVVLVVIFLGANDAALPSREQHTSVEEYRANLVAILSHFRVASPSAALILVTPPPVLEELWGAHCESKGRALDRLDEVTRKYSQACVEVGREEGVAVVDLQAAMGGAQGARRGGLLVDGLHFTGEGNKVVFTSVMSAIREWYPHLAPERLPMQGPDHSTLTGKTRRLLRQQQQEQEGEGGGGMG